LSADEQQECVFQDQGETIPEYEVKDSDHPTDHHYARAMAMKRNLLL
jgi:hypothetical protein